MSKSEELSRCEEPLTTTSRSLPHKDMLVIPRDMYGLYGVHVTNLPSDISEELLKKTFSSVGKVAVCKVIDPKTHPEGSFPIYAFVKFSTRKEAFEALSKFDGYTINDSILAVRPAYNSRRTRRDQPQRHRGTDVFSNKSEINGNANKEQETSRKSYVMNSSDCRVRDGKLQEGDVVVYRGTSAKSSPTKGCSGQKVVPQFKISSSADDSKNFRVVSPAVTSDTAVQATRQTNHDPSGIFTVQTSDINDSCSNTTTSAFHLYQGMSGIQKQLPIASYVQQQSTVENGFTHMNSDLSHLQLSPSNFSTENYPQGSEVLSWKGDVPQSATARNPSPSQSATTWNPSPFGGTGVTYFSDRNKPANSPGKSCQLGSSVAAWSTTDVVQFFYNTDCAEYVGFFQEQEIDGRALMLLNRDTLLQLLKVGPALKILQKIDELRSGRSSLVTGVNGC